MWLQGPVMQFKLPAQNMIVLSSAKATSDLLDKRGSIYSDRPAFPMLELSVLVSTSTSLTV